MMPNLSPVAASAEGIVLCLQLLMEEAASLNLHQASAALAHAMRLAVIEGEQLGMMPAGTALSLPTRAVGHH